MFRVLLLILMLLPLSAMAQDSLKLEGWPALSILHEGRLKPIDSFARVHLKMLSGKDRIAGNSASEWLAQILFAPDEAAMVPVFKIRNFEAYGLEKKSLYSYVEISPALHKKKALINSILETKPKDWTPSQEELITLYKNVSIYVQLLRSLTGVLPLNIQDDKSYFDLQNNKNTKSISQPLAIIKEGGKNNIYLHLVPKDWDNLDGEWQSIWDIIRAPKTDKETLAYLKTWQKLASAYRVNDQGQWDKTLSEAPESLRNTRSKTEVIYNTIKLLATAGILYLLSFSFIVASSLLQKIKLIRFAFAFLCLSVIANGLDIILRIYILNRPPVGTLYESIIFVSFICVLGFLFFEKKYKNQTGLLLGSISGIFLITTAKSFAGDDTMNTLVAVLNTNFWLLTHVICITIGYAICFLSAMLAHYYLALKLWKPRSKEALKSLNKAIKTLVIIALLFTCIGTILGGIWADQSWGRFWGWDPKENGALLIVLWLIWMLHGRISQHISETGFVVSAAFLSVIVVIAWFGVNLLSVGLHSYGFISGVAFGIGAFCILETILIGSLWLLGKRDMEEAP